MGSEKLLTLSWDVSTRGDADVVTTRLPFMAAVQGLLTTSIQTPVSAHPYHSLRHKGYIRE